MHILLQKIQTYITKLHSPLKTMSFYIKTNSALNITQKPSNRKTLQINKNSVEINSKHNHNNLLLQLMMALVVFPRASCCSEGKCHH